MSMELNKILGAVLLAGVIAMMSGLVANLLFHPADLQQNAYVIEVDDAETSASVEAVATEEVLAPITPLLASADVAAGEKASRKCSACHSFNDGGANKVGPNLWNIVGTPKGSNGDFSYSSAMAGFGGEWNFEALNGFLANPKGYMAGTKMAYAGLKKEADRANIIAWMRTLSANPVPLQ